MESKAFICPLLVFLESTSRGNVLASDDRKMRHRYRFMEEWI